MFEDQINGPWLGPQKLKEGHRVPWNPPMSDMVPPATEDWVQEVSKTVVHGSATSLPPHTMRFNHGRCRTDGYIRCHHTPQGLIIEDVEPLDIVDATTHHKV